MMLNYLPFALNHHNMIIHDNGYGELGTDTLLFKICPEQERIQGWGVIWILAIPERTAHLVSANKFRE